MENVPIFFTILFYVWMSFKSAVFAYERTVYDPLWERILVALGTFIVWPILALLHWDKTISKEETL